MVRRIQKELISVLSVLQFIVQLMIAPVATAQSEAGSVDLTPAAGEATIVRNSNGTARVLFQPRDGLQKPVVAFSDTGKSIGIMSWQALFEVEVTHAALDSATTPAGIDLEKLMLGVGALRKLPDGRKLVRAELPYEVQDPSTHTSISAGKEVYFALDTFIKGIDVAPVGARASQSQDRPVKESAIHFNEVLSEKGVVEKPKTKLSERPQPLTAPKIAKPSANSEQRVPKNSSFTDDLRFLSPPTCSCNLGGRDCLLWSAFGPRPTYKQFHAGIDISAGTGTPVRAAAKGCVKRQTIQAVRSGGGWGNSVFLDHGEGVETHYAHMSKFAPNLKVGQCYERGELIGYVGSTGHTKGKTGQHLHFGAYIAGRSVDPDKYLLVKSNADLNKQCSDLDAYNETIRKDHAEALQAAFSRVVASSGTVRRPKRDSSAQQVTAASRESAISN